MRTQLIAAANAAVLALVGATSALAQSAQPPGADNSVVPQAVIGGDYSYLGLDDGLGHADLYGGELGGVTPFNSDFSGQASGGYRRIDTSGYGADNWSAAGAVAWSQPWGRLGASVGYNTASLTGVRADVANYGVYGEYFGDAFTLGLRGGGATGSASALGFSTGAKTTGYGGGEAIGYPAPDLAVKGAVNYVVIAAGHLWTAGVHGEYLLSQTTPVSGWVGYDYADLGADGFSVHGKTFSVGLRYYFGAGGSLQQRQRTGVDDWGPRQLDLTE